jgi:hypothetical protein
VRAPRHVVTNMLPLWPWRSALRSTSGKTAPSHWGPGYRVYLAKDGEALLLLFCGGTKKRQQADIATALALHAEYKARKKAATKKAR